MPRTFKEMRKLFKIQTSACWTANTPHTHRDDLHTHTHTHWDPQLGLVADEEAALSSILDPIWLSDVQKCRRINSAISISVGFGPFVALVAGLFAGLTGHVPMPVFAGIRLNSQQAHRAYCRADCHVVRHIGRIPECTLSQRLGS